MGATIPILLLTLILNLGCTHLFLQPSREEYFRLDPEKVIFEERFIESTDQVRLHSWYFPAHVSRKKIPAKGLVVQFHGNAQNLTAHFASWVWVIERGYDFLSIDYRGYGKSTGDKDPEGAIQDVISVIEYSKKLKPASLHLVGQSLGGALLMKGVTRMKKKGDNLNFISSLTIESSFSNYPKMASDVLSRFWLTWPFQFLGRILVSNDPSVDQDLDLISPIPLLVIHGTKDSVVPYSMGERLYQKALPPKEFWRVENGQHIDTFVHSKSREEYQQRWIKRVSEINSRPLSP